MNDMPKILALNFMGCLWGYMGMNLIRKGILALFSNIEFNMAVGLTLVALVLGIVKSILILKKTADRLVKRTQLIKGFFSMFKIFDVRFLILIALMMSLGIGLGLISGIEGVVGTVRITVGYALLQSSFYFFKPAFLHGLMPKN